MGVVCDQGHRSQPSTQVRFAEGDGAVEFGEVEQYVRRRLADEYVFRLGRGC